MDFLDFKHLGVDGQLIPQQYIPYPHQILKHLDGIKGCDEGELLIYSKKDKAYRLFTDKANQFLSTPIQEWRKCN